MRTGTWLHLDKGYYVILIKDNSWYHTIHALDMKYNRLDSDSIFAAEENTEKAKELYQVSQRTKARTIVST